MPARSAPVAEHDSTDHPGLHHLRRRATRAARVALRLVPSVRHLVCGQSSQAPNPKEWPPGPWLAQPIACDGPRKTADCRTAVPDERARWVGGRILQRRRGCRAGLPARPRGAPDAGRAAARLEYARHGRSLGGESPLEEEVVLTPSRRQLRRREAGWEGSPRRNPAPRNTNRVQGGAIWVSLLKKVKPVITNRVVT